MFTLNFRHSSAHLLKVLAVAMILAAGGSVSTAVFAMDPALLQGGAKITLNFADTQQNKLVLVGAIPEIPNVVFTNAVVGISLGGVQRTYTLSPEGEGVGTPDLFHIRDTGSGLAFIVSTFDNSLTNVYQTFGLTNDNVLNKRISIPASLTFNGVKYATTLTGVYDAEANVTGKGFLGVIQAPAKPFDTITHIATLAASPNPTTANTPVTIKGTVSLKNFNGAVSGTLHFGDMSPPVVADGATFQSTLKDGISHTYLADGVYVARVTLIGGDEIADTRLFVIVGAGWVVNSQNGAIGRLFKSPGGTVSLQVGLDNVPGGMSAQTKFMDMQGNTAGVPPSGPPPANGQTGLAPSNTFLMSGLYVAQSMALDANGKPLGMLRKSIVIGNSDVGSSTGAQNAQTATSDGDTASVAVESPIALATMAGKFYLGSTSDDKVIFNGTIALPAGYNPKNPAGNDLTIAMGNVIDKIHLMPSGKLKTPTSSGYVTRFHMAMPKLANGVAAGGEKATVSMTIVGSNLDTKGFDTEGISSSVRSDETGQTEVARFIQVDMLISGTTYSGLAQVNYSTSTNASGDSFGNVSSRSSK